MPWRFILWRLAGMVAVLVAMTFLVFLLQQVVPSDPARAAVGPSAPQSVVDAKRKELGLDQPLLVQYGRYMQGLVRGDLGQSVTTLNPVTTDLRHYLPASLELITYSLAIAAVFAMAF